MQFLYRVGTRVCPLFVVVYLWHNVLHLTASLVGAVIISESVHHLFILELVPVRHWKITREKLSLAGFKPFIRADGHKLTPSHINEQLQNYSIEKKKNTKGCLFDKLKVKHVKGGSLVWTQGGIYPRKLLLFAQSRLKLPHKTKRTTKSHNHDRVSNVDL